MIVEEKKLLFSTANIILEDDKFLSMLKSGRYSKIVAMSYDKLSVDNCKLRTKTTSLVKLDRDEDEIFSKFSDTTRNEIRRTFRNDELKFVFSDNITDDSYQLYKRFEYLQGRVPVSKKSLQQCVLFSAYYRGEIISAIYVMKIKPYLRIRSIFSKRLEIEDKDLYKVISNATRRVVWEVCLWGIKNNFSSLDMASVNMSNPKTISISKFKISFGGDIINEYTYIYKTKIFTWFEKIVHWRLVSLKLLNKLKKLLCLSK